MTGARREPIDRRRLKGAHQELKRLLVEGINDSGEPTHRWKGFSDAMARQGVEEAVSSLPPRQKQLIKLAYFSDLSNREIAQGLGITVSSVERGLRQAIARLSEYVERGGAAARRAIYALALLLGGRWLSDAAHQASGPTTGQLVRVGALVVAAATAGAVLISQPASPAQLTQLQTGGTPAITSAQPYAAMQRHAVQIPKVAAGIAERAKSQATAQAAKAGVQVVEPNVALPVVTVPVVTLPLLTLPIPVQVPPVPVEVPPLPPLPIIHGLLGA
jgi:DNA-binding CsgD family transcriptional regulator